MLPLLFIFKSFSAIWIAVGIDKIENEIQVFPRFLEVGMVMVESLLYYLAWINKWSGKNKRSMVSFSKIKIWNSDNFVCTNDTGAQNRSYFYNKIRIK